MSVQPKQGGSQGGETRESVVYHLANDMLKKLPKQYKDFEVNNYYSIIVYFGSKFLIYTLITIGQRVITKNGRTITHEHISETGNRSGEKSNRNCPKDTL